MLPTISAELTKDMFSPSLVGASSILEEECMFLKATDTSLQEQAMNSIWKVQQLPETKPAKGRLRGSHFPIHYAEQWTTTLLAGDKNKDP